MSISEGSTSAQAPVVGLRSHCYEFGPYRLDVLQQRLMRGDEPVPITPKTLDLLLLLLRHRDRVIPKAELMRELWPDIVVEEANLTQQIFTLRKILGESPGATYVETVPRRGYRFLAEVRELKDAGAGHTDWRSGRRPMPVGRRAAYVIVGIALAAVVGSLATRRYWAGQSEDAPVMLAVLPLERLNPDLRQPAGDGGRDFTESLAIGIPDGIITRLSSVRPFRVRPTSAVARYSRQGIDVQDAGRRLAAQYVLAGTIRSSGERVRVSVQLVRTTDGSPVWGHQYDVARGDLLGIEDALAGEIASALRVRLSEAERERLYRRYTRDGAAYERYLMGRALLRSATERDALQAIAEFEAARDLDPNYALAYAGLATAAAQLRVRFAARDEAQVWDARARQEAGRALQLDPDLAEAHVALAAVHRFQEYDWNTVIRESRRALELNPSLDTPHLHLAVAYFHLGLLDEAESAVQAARQANPDNHAEPLEILGAVALFAGRTADAVAHLSQVEHFSDSRIVKYLLGWALYYEGDQARAESVLRNMIDDKGPLPANARATLAAILAARGATAEARALAERVASEPGLIHHATYGLGTAYAQLHDPSTAVRWLSQAAATGFNCYPWYERDPLLDPIRQDEGFANFLRDLRRSWNDARAKYGTPVGAQP